MERLRSLAIVSGLAGIFALGFSAPVLAKVKEGQSESDVAVLEEASTNNGDTAQSLSETVLADAARLCQLLVEDKREILDALLTEGWTHEVDYNVGNAPFYKELSGEFYYENVGPAEIWAFVENYPGYKMGYCSFKIPDPEIRFSLNSLSGMEGFVGETQISGEEVFGTWREDSEVPKTFIHVYHNADTFNYQITRINTLD